MVVLLLNFAQNYFFCITVVVSGTNPSNKEYDSDKKRIDCQIERRAVIFSLCHLSPLENNNHFNLMVFRISGYSFRSSGPLASPVRSDERMGREGLYGLSPPL